MHFSHLFFRGEGFSVEGFASALRYILCLYFPLLWALIVLSFGGREKPRRAQSNRKYKHKM
jgi:hypothetical protein